VLDEHEGPLSWREWLAHKHQQYNITRSAASLASAPNSLRPRLVAVDRRRVRGSGLSVSASASPAVALPPTRGLERACSVLYMLDWWERLLFNIIMIRRAPRAHPVFTRKPADSAARRSVLHRVHYFPGLTPGRVCGLAACL
jgi:hypothetical protein